MENQGNTSTKLLLAKNKLFRAIAHIRPGRTTFVNVFRRDTLERYDFFGTKSIDRHELITLACKYIDNLEKPVDWNAPHRYCVAYYGRLTKKGDYFCDGLYKDKQDDRKILRYMTYRLLKETILIKKVNLLSFEEKCPLLIIKDWELEAHATARIGYGIFGRGYLYKRLYDKQGLEKYYKKYCQKIEKYMGRLDKLIYNP